jgi:hypothetical protein
MMKIDKAKMIDSKGAALTQGLFLETSYGNTENVMYTLKSRDHFYKGRLLPSIKRLYLEMEDITEYSFAYAYFLDWEHWKRIKANALIAKHMEGWREELEVRVAAGGIRAMQDMACDIEKPNFQAAKYIADRGWERRAVGRPSKEAVQREIRIAAKLSDEFTSDIERLKR